MSVPLTVHIMRTLWNNLILIGHNTLIIIVVLLIFPSRAFPWVSLYAIPGFLLIVILLFLVSVMLGIICTRFRDITQIVAVFMQLIYFFTPIIWMKNVLPGKHSWVMDFNPFYHMVEIIRGTSAGNGSCACTLVVYAVVHRRRCRFIHGYCDETQTSCVLLAIGGMMAQIQVSNLVIDYPIFDSSSRSFKKTIVRGGHRRADCQRLPRHQHPGP